MITPIIVAHAKAQKQTGIIVSEHVTPILDPNVEGGLRFSSVVGVLWDEIRSPAPSYHRPEELVWLSVPAIDSVDGEDDEDENEEDDSEGAEEDESENEEDDTDEEYEEGVEYEEQASNESHSA